MKRNFLFFLFLIFCYGSAIAATIPVIVLKTDTNEVWLDKGMFGIFEDPTAKVPFAIISSLAYQDSFRLSNEDYHYNEHEPSAYWIKFIVDGSLTSDEKFVLEG